jgi:uncharacterized protein YcfJ
VAGQLLGSVAGGLIGSQVGRGNCLLAATAAGAVLGSMAGARY